MTAKDVRPDDRLRFTEKTLLVLFALAVLAFGVLIELRSAFQKTSKTDFGVYARAAWAVRDGHDIYHVTDNNGWHYCYPPALAIVLAPLADPNPWEPRDWYLKYSVSVAIWFAFGLVCVAYGTHVLARSVLPGEARGSRRWWYARSVPVLVCLGGIGFTLSRGQVNVLLTALIAGMFASAIAGRRTASGLWLAGAVALKVFPLLLVLDPLFRRDRRAIAGTVLGGVLLFGVLPAMVWGVSGAIEHNRKLVELVLQPGTTGGGDQTRAEELTNTTSTDSQSFAAAIHAWIHPDRLTRPTRATKETTLAHWAIGGTMTLVTLLFAWRRLSNAPADRLLFLGCLCVVMMLLTPVSHMHYYALAFPLVSGLWLKGLLERPSPIAAGPGTFLVLVTWGILTAVPLLPGEACERLREAGLGTLASVGLWAFGLGRMGGRVEGDRNDPGEISAVYAAPVQHSERRNTLQRFPMPNRRSRV